MADIVASSVVQAVVSWVLSYVSDKLEEKASHGHSKARLEMALSRVKFALEMTGEWPITYDDLLHRRMMLKQGYMEGTDLLNELKLQSSEGREEIGQWATGSSFLQRILLSLIGLSKENISSSIVRKFEWLADCADKFKTHVESGCPLRDKRLLSPYPLERQLLEGKTLQFRMLKGSQSQYICMLPVRLEDRGMAIEVLLRYEYEDRKMPANRFFLTLCLRLSKDKSIVETAIRCLQFLTKSLVVPTFESKRLTEFVIEKITLISKQDFTHSYGAPPGFRLEDFVAATRFYRQDPICCTNNVVSSELSHGVPEPVMSILFSCCISAPEYMLNNSADEVVGANAPFLDLHYIFAPHILTRSTRQERVIIVKFKGKRERLNGSKMELMGPVLRSRAFDCLDRSPEAAEYDVRWYSEHAAAGITLKKPRPERHAAAGITLKKPRPEMQCLQPTAVPRPGRRGPKRKR